MDTIATLIRALERHPAHERLRPAPEAIDLGVLRALADNPEVIGRVRHPAQVRRLWDACSLPDFRKSGMEHHARLVFSVWQYISQGAGHIPHEWFAGQIARLDDVQGDVETLAGRISAVRTWAYVSQRSDWLANPVEMAARTVALEEKLSDALHGALTQRFVDKRTSILLRDIGRDASLLPVDVDPSGAVTVDGQTIGHLKGFRFFVDPQARAVQKRMLLAAAERRLGKVLTERAQAILTASDGALRLHGEPGTDPTIQWEDVTLATLKRGQRLLAPELQMDTGLTALPPELQAAVKARVEAWIDAQFLRHIPALQKMDAGSQDPAVPAQVRAVLAQLTDAGGVADRTPLDDALGAVEKTDRGQLRKSGVVIGVLDLYHPGLMKPGAALWRMVLMMLRAGRPLVALPPAGTVLMQAEGENAPNPEGARIAGFRRFANVWLRIDIAERVARTGHEAIAANRPYHPTEPHVVSIGLPPEGFADLMRQAGFRAITPAPIAPATLAQADVAAPQDAEEAVTTQPEAAAPVVAPAEALPEAIATDSETEALPVAPVQAEADVEARAEVSPAELPDAPESQVEAPDPTLAASAASDSIGASTADEEAATGANWVFRGRPKARPPRPPRGDNRRSAQPGQRHGEQQRGGQQRDGQPRDGQGQTVQQHGDGAQRPRRDDRGPRDGQRTGQRDGQRDGQRRDGPPPKRQDRGDRPDRSGGGERRDQRQPVPVGSATSKALSGLADLLKRDG
ncbi:MAG: hypothetical protein ABW192_03980, partial [Sphingobium sp.]